MIMHLRCLVLGAPPAVDKETQCPNVNQEGFIVLDCGCPCLRR